MRRKDQGRKRAPEDLDCWGIPGRWVFMMTGPSWKGTLLVWLQSVWGPKCNRTGGWTGVSCVGEVLDWANVVVKCWRRDVEVLYSTRDLMVLGNGISHRSTPLRTTVHDVMKFKVISSPSECPISKVRVCTSGKSSLVSYQGVNSFQITPLQCLF
jgi:hypothetical protein